MSDFDDYMDSTDRVYYLAQINEELEKENQNFLDTFQAIYEKLGLTEDNVNGKELVSDTVKRRITEIVDAYTELKFRMESLEK